MAVPRKLIVVPNSATRELWRIAESGDVDELAAVLPQAEINARNEHGMTALMRAASHGHVQVVRVLLEHGADPNVRRNDNFTALSLAAFFGHAEIVETLMRHGANAQVATRFGTSPHMWAKARSFGDVARCLEKRTAQRPAAAKQAEPVLPGRPISTESAKPVAAPPVVRALKEPPEIWDLVQEAPRNFNPRSAFIARVGSLNGALVVSMIVLLVLVGLGAGAWLFLKNSVRVSTVPAAAAPAPAAAPVAAPAAVESPETSNVVAEIPVVVSETVNTVVTTNTPRRSRRVATSRAISDEVTVQSESGEITAAPPVVATPQFDSRASSAAEIRKSPPPANSTVISPPKSTQPKAKVIQWP